MFFPNQNTLTFLTLKPQYANKCYFMLQDPSWVTPALGRFFRRKLAFTFTKTNYLVEILSSKVDPCFSKP